ncbi:MAG: DUF6468 domain-containing protein, partial [Caulobacteraceae bacterium]
MIAISLNLILGMLLCCALVLGVRLERKLRGLRDSHADFAKAVSELDQAAGRTESSLATLRAGTETARNEVASRIDQARIACQRLEKLVADADKAADRLAAQPLVLLDRASPPPPRAAQPAPAPAPAPSAIARPQPEYMWADDLMAARPAPAPTPVPPARSRARMIDDDLFVSGPQPVVRRPAVDAFVAPAPAPAPAPSPVAERREFPLRADNDPVVGAARRDRTAREAFRRHTPEPEPAARDPFEEGRFAHERRVMLAAVMGGR